MRTLVPNDDNKITVILVILQKRKKVKRTLRNMKKARQLDQIKYPLRCGSVLEIKEFND